jgi:hypothetical protein
MIDPRTKGTIMTKTLKSVALALAAALAVACASEKMPAEAALKAAEAAVAAVKAEAVKYVPEQFTSVEGALASARQAFDKGEYKTALASANEAAAKVKDLAAAVAAKKDELMKGWGEMAGSLPKMVEALKSRIDILSQAKKLPEGMDAAKLDTAKSGLAAVTQTWNEASEAFKGGNLTDALAKAKAVKAKGMEVMGLLGMQGPAQ